MNTLPIHQSICVPVCAYPSIYRPTYLCITCITAYIVPALKSGRLRDGSPDRLDAGGSPRGRRTGRPPRPATLRATCHAGRNVATQRRTTERPAPGPPAGTPRAALPCWRCQRTIVRRISTPTICSRESPDDTNSAKNLHRRVVPAAGPKPRAVTRLSDT
jgi:hypothetical protein